MANLTNSRPGSRIELLERRLVGRLLDRQYTLSQSNTAFVQRLMLPNEAFLSHSNDDAPFVAEVATILYQHGIPVWFSGTNIVGAQQWHDEIGAALARCDWFVLVLSPSSTQSMWVKRELFFALQQNRFENRIVPLLYRPCDPSMLSWTLPSIQLIDFTANTESAYRELLRIWGMGYDPGRHGVC